MSTPISPPIFRYTYTSKRDHKRYTTRVTIYSRIESDGVVILLLSPIGRWQDRDDLDELAAVAEERGVPMVSSVILSSESEQEWRRINLKAEDEGWEEEAA